MEKKVISFELSQKSILAAINDLLKDYIKLELDRTTEESGIPAILSIFTCSLVAMCLFSYSDSADKAGERIEPVVTKITDLLMEEIDNMKKGD